jgi:transcriptional regulator of NAD metabolism
VLEEFLTVIELGGRILDVSVEHELYGPIRADLLIENRADAEDFVRRLAACRDNPLKVLTDDCHFHTVTAPSEKLLDLMEAELRAKGYLE